MKLFENTPEMRKAVYRAALRETIQAMRFKELAEISIAESVERVDPEVYDIHRLRGEGYRMVISILEHGLNHMTVD